jgi:TolB-like protein/class 3 adenylate cyclase/Tfp pilus assembly protein PilF
MAEDRPQRRLAAILAADVVGYSRLMEADEAGTLAALKARRRQVLEPLVARHQGRVFKITGDGVLVEFASAVNAMQCAVELQQAMAVANGDQPEDRHIVLRIGVNLGDVIVEGGDCYGDGVNIAARLEGIAGPGTILVSGTIYDHARKKINATFEDLGTQTLKNIAEPVRVYRIADTPRVFVATAKTAIDKPSIAVLPFINMSADREQQYFSDGITEDIITELSRFHSLLVIARNSSFQYRAAADVKQIAQELRVQYVVEGSVRRSSGRARITAQLVEGETGNHLWAEHYDRTLEDIFIVQDEVAQAIAATIEGRMAASGARRSRRKPTNDLAAYDYFLQGRESIETRGDPDAAARLLRRAIELDPGYAQAHAWLSRVHIHLFHLDLRSETLREALMLAQTALLLDEADAWCHAALGYAYLIARQHDLAGIHLDRAVALNPMDVRITSKRALWLTYTGRPDEAARSLDADLRRDPFPPAWYWDFLGIALFEARRYEEAIQALSRLTKLYRWDYYYLAASYAHLGLLDRARASGAEILRLDPDFALAQVAPTEPFQDPASLDHLLDGLRKAGLRD